MCLSKYFAPENYNVTCYLILYIITYLYDEYLKASQNIPSRKQWNNEHMRI